MDRYLIVMVVVAAAAVMMMALLWRLKRRKPARSNDTVMMEDRLDTLIGWPPQATRILRTPERVAFSTLKLALPGYMILAQVPVARFISVPKRNSYAEWMRRLGSQCVDFVVCDITSQVVAVIDVRPPQSQLSDRLHRRLDRLDRTLAAVGIPIHVWNEDALPSVEAARASVLPKMPAVPAEMASRKSASRTAAALAQSRTAFVDTDRDPSRDEVIEVIEMSEPSSSTWFDELDSVPPSLPPLAYRNGR